MINIDTLNTCIKGSILTRTNRYNTLLNMVGYNSSSSSTSTETSTSTKSKVIASTTKDLDVKSKDLRNSIKNTTTAYNVLDTGKDSLTDIYGKFLEIKEITERAGSGTYTTEELAAMQSAIDTLLSSINNIKNNSNFNGINVFSEETKTQTITVIREPENRSSDAPENTFSKATTSVETIIADNRTEAATPSVFGAEIMSEEDIISSNTTEVVPSSVFGAEIMSVEDIISSNTTQTQVEAPVFTTNVKTVSESQTELGTYTMINSTEDFNNIRNNLSGNYILNCDIDLSGIANWTPIGTSDNAFTGKLYGAGHKITGLTIDSTTNNTGLFGYTSGATIRDLQIDGADITSTGDNTGTLAGYLNGGTIYNVAITNTTVNGDVFTGGVVGLCENNCTITNSYSTGSVTGGDYTGGLAGDCNCSTITNSYSTGDVTGGDYTGGLAGDCVFGTITNSYSTGDVTGNACTGGLTGYLYYATIQNSYTSSEVIRSNESRTSFGECYGSDEPELLGSNNNENTITNTYAIDQTEDWFETEQTGVTLVSSTSQMTGLGDAWDLTGDHPTLVSNPESVTTTQNIPPDITYISTAADLANISNNLNGIYVLTSDIDLSGIDNWTPIGTSDNAFTGKLYGGGHKITGLTIDSTTNNTGLFGYTSGATIRDLQIDGADITSTGENTGTLVGYLNGGTIDNVAITNTTVNGNNQTGGLAGYCEGTITNSYSTGDVTGNDNTGGVVGGIISGTISNAYSACSVTGTSNTGGLAGRNQCTISNSYFTGSVTGTNDNIGGVAGYCSGTISNSYSTGDVSGNDNTGGLAGSLTFATIRNSYASGNVLRKEGSSETSFGECYGFDNGPSWGEIPSTIENTYAIDQTEDWFETEQTGVTLVSSTSQMTGLGDGWDLTGDHPTLISNPEPVTTTQNIPPEITYISTAADLANISNNLNGIYVLTSDIDLSGIDNWTPIGTLDNDFTGKFYGGGHKITGLTINSTTDNAGLFGHTSGATIRDLQIDGASVTSTGNYTGTLAGYAFSGTTIENIAITNTTVSGNNHTGGVVGNCFANCTITNSYSTGDVSGNYYTGGVAGDCYDNCTITNSYSTGSVSGNDYTGGVAGWCDSTIANSYSTGSVSENARTGGVAGHCSGTISNSYSTGDVSGNNYTGGIAGYLWGATIENSYASGDVLRKDGSSSTDFGECYGYDKEGSTIENTYAIGQTGEWFGTAQTGVTLVSSTSQMTGLGDGWDLTGDHPTLVSNPESVDPSEATMPDITYISSAQDLQNITNDLNGIYVLTSDIDLSGVSNWAPIGTSDNAFTGKFYGGGHKITGLTINSSTDNTGLFGYTVGATIQDVQIDGANIISMGDYTGVLAGRASTGTKIDNVSVTSAIVNGKTSTGGLLGDTYETEITNSYVTGTVTGTGNNTGGITGKSNGGKIENSAAYAVVNGTVNTGGISGYNDGTDIINSYSTKTVSGTENVGGISGRMDLGNISNSYSVGDVKGTQNVGGTVGNLINSQVYNTYSAGTIQRTSGTETSFGAAFGNTSASDIQNNYAKEQTGNFFTTEQGSGVTVLSVITSEALSSLNNQTETANANQWDLTDHRPTLLSNKEGIPENSEPIIEQQEYTIVTHKPITLTIDGTNDITMNTGVDTNSIIIDLTSAENISKSTTALNALLAEISKKQNDISNSQARVQILLSDQSEELQQINKDKDALSSGNTSSLSDYSLSVLTKKISDEKTSVSAYSAQCGNLKLSAVLKILRG